jgi:hypothetical protein
MSNTWCDILLRTALPRETGVALESPEGDCTCMPRVCHSNAAAPERPGVAAYEAARLRKGYGQGIRVMNNSTQRAPGG